MTIVLFAWETYHDLALDNQRKLLKAELQDRSSQVVAEMEGYVLDVALHLRELTKFKDSFKKQDREALARLLDDQFQQYYVSAGLVKLFQIYVYSPGFDLVSQSNGGIRAHRRVDVLCADLVNVASLRSGHDRLKSISGLCASSGRVYYSLIIPTDSFVANGYLQIVIDPFVNLIEIEKRMGMPIAISSPNKEDIYRGSRWADSNNDVITADVWLETFDQRPLLLLSVEQSIANFAGEIGAARNKLILFAGGITLLSVILAFWLLQRTTLKPLQRFIEQLSDVRRDWRQLGAAIDFKGNAELTKLFNVFNDMSTELARLYDEYEKMAFTDQLTNLPNRALFNDRLAQMILSSKRRGEKLGVLLLDLDGFKEVNDTLGHHVGDVLLQQVGERLQRILRASSTLARVSSEDEPYYPDGQTADDVSTVARLGGDEFAVLLPALKNVDGAIKVAKRIVEVLDSPIEIEGNNVIVTGTLGIAMYPEHGEDGATLLRRVDIALYVAKNIQSSFSVYDAAYDRHSVNQLALKAELRAGIEQDQMILFYQPKLNIARGCVTGVEALIRWRHPERGMIPPDQFIPLSEQRGLIGPLTDWVIRRALLQYKEWQRQGIELQVAVNLSSRVLYDLSLPNRIESTLRDLELPPSALCLEVTEQATMQDPKRAMEILNRLDQMGVSLSIDDFGTGYSSLGYLKNLPVDEIKIDKSFVMEMEKSENDAKIVHATIDLAHNLGLRVVAEGVENELVLKMLRSLNCDYVQGYHLARPLPPEDLVEWIRKSEWVCGV
ncbi:MAG: EAL domain-containing protein [Gammaproteobacteria bacterium]|nr:EAL domain-containing protein [Gammaproteobacteria bacterium]